MLVGERVEAESPNPRGLATGVARAVDGRVLERVEAVGKNVLLHFDGGVVVRSHLRMNGRWRVGRRADSRWRGSPWLVLRGSEWEATQWNGPVLRVGDEAVRSLGPDLLAPTTDPAALVARLRRVDQSRLVGDALVDQRIVAGIGNMWLAEALWHGRVSPWSHLADVGDDDLAGVLQWARASDARRGRGEPPVALGLSPCGPRLPALRRADPLARARRRQPNGVLVPGCQPVPAISGGGGLRTLEAGFSPPNALAGRRLQPLGHFSRRAQGYRSS